MTFVSSTGLQKVLDIPDMHVYTTLNIQEPGDLEVLFDWHF